MQRALLQWKNPNNRRLVIEALKKAGRTDLIGYDKKCLIRPRSGMAVRPTGDRVRTGGKPKPAQGPTAQARPASGKAAPQKAKSKQRGEGWAKPKAKSGTKPNSRKKR
jgi:hypothetical protein